MINGEILMGPLEKAQWLHKVLFDYYIIMDDYRNINQKEKTLDDILAIILNGMEVIKETVAYETNFYNTSLYKEINSMLLNKNNIDTNKLLDSIITLYENYMEQLERISGRLVS